MRPQASSELMLLECSVDEEGVDHHGLDEGLEAICVAMCCDVWDCRGREPALQDKGLGHRMLGSSEGAGD